MNQSLQPSSTRAEVIVCLTHIDGPLTTSSLWMFWCQHSVTEAALHYMYRRQRDTGYSAARIAEMSEIIGITTSWDFHTTLGSGLQLWSFLHCLYPPVERNIKSQRKILIMYEIDQKLSSYQSKCRTVLCVKGQQLFYLWILLKSLKKIST